jgi:hypothetical protein
LVCGCMTIRRCVAYHNDLRWTLTHQCHCACSSEIGTCIINDAGRQAAPRWLHTKKPPMKIYVFSVESRETTLYTHVLKVYINFQQQKNFHKKNTNLQHYPFKTGYHEFHYR